MFQGYRTERFHKLRITARTIVFAWFFIGGMAHLVVPDLFASTIPPAIPYALAWVYVSGFFELLGAVGLLIRKVRKRAGLGLMVLTVCVTPANIYMWLHPDMFPEIPPAILLWRLPLQVVLLAAIYFASRVPPQPSWGRF